MANRIITSNINRTDLVEIDGKQYTRIGRVLNKSMMFYYIDETGGGNIVMPKIAVKLEIKFQLILSALANQN